MAIQSFRDAQLARIAADLDPGKGFPTDLVRVVRRKLRDLDAAMSLNDLTSSRGLRLEALRADRLGQHSVRVNDQFRLCFVWTDGGPSEVEFVDYH